MLDTCRGMLYQYAAQHSTQQTTWYHHTVMRLHGSSHKFCPAANTCNIEDYTMRSNTMTHMCTTLFRIR